MAAVVAKHRALVGIQAVVFGFGWFVVRVPQTRQIVGIAALLVQFAALPNHAQAAQNEQTRADKRRRRNRHKAQTHQKHDNGGDEAGRFSHRLHLGVALFGCRSAGQFRCDTDIRGGRHFQKARFVGFGNLQILHERA